MQVDSLAGVQRDIDQHNKQLNGIRNVLQTIAQDIEKIQAGTGRGVTMYDLPPSTRRNN